MDAYDRITYFRHQRVILNYFGYSPFDEAAKIITADEITTLIKVQFRPKLVLLEIIQVLTVKKIAIPSYNVLADLIIAALNRHQRTLSEIIDGCLTENQHANLDNLLEKEPISGTEVGWRFSHIPEEAISIHSTSENQSKSGRLRYRADTLS